MKRTRQLKSLVKSAYDKNMKKESVEIGRKINTLTQTLHQLHRLPEEKRDAELYKNTLEELIVLKKERRLRDDFPSFSQFYAYVVNPKNKFTIEDVKEL